MGFVCKLNAECFADIQRYSFKCFSAVIFSIFRDKNIRLSWLYAHSLLAVTVQQCLLLFSEKWG